MQLGLIIETNDAEGIWNGFSLATTALDADHTVEVFLLGDGVEAPNIETEQFNPEAPCASISMQWARSSRVVPVSIHEARGRRSSPTQHDDGLSQHRRER